MKIARIAGRLSERRIRARRPLRITSRIAAAEASNVKEALYTSVARRWRRSAARANGGTAIENHHSNLSLHVSRRVDLHLTCNLALRSRQPISGLASFTGVRLTRDFGQGPMIFGEGATAGHGRPRTGNMPRVWRQDNAGLTSLRHVSNRRHWAIVTPAGATENVVRGRQFVARRANHGGSVISSVIAAGSGSHRQVQAVDSTWLGHSHRVSAATSAGQKMRVTGSRLPESITVRPAALQAVTEPVLLVQKMLARSGNANDVTPGRELVSGMDRRVEHDTPSIRPRQVAPLELVWSEPAGGDRTEAQAARRYSIVSDQALETAIGSGSGSFSERRLAGAHEAMGGGWLTGPVVERLADDVMRRIEKNFRIERERHGK